MRLADKVAVITGGAAGIGFQYAKRFLAEGARVVVADVVDPLAAAEKLGAADRVLGVRTDVSIAASVGAMVAAAVATFGRIDVLVNNAAIFATLKPQPFEEIPEAEWDRVMAVNVKGVWNCARAVAPLMRAQGGGRIVNVASAIVAKGTAFLMHYVTSKGAVVAMTRALARELGPAGITVNADRPGPDPERYRAGQPGHHRLSGDGHHAGALAQARGLSRRRGGHRGLPRLRRQRVHDAARRSSSTAARSSRPSDGGEP